MINLDTKVIQDLIGGTNPNKDYYQTSSIVINNRYIYLIGGYKAGKHVEYYDINNKKFN